MDGRGGCCIARYDGGGGGGAYDTSKIDRIMLRFRPIAPKPAVSGSVSGETTPEKNDSFVRSGGGKAKRRYVKDSSNNNNNNNSTSKRCCRKRRTVAPAVVEEEDDEVEKDTVVTLSLLPEQPDRKESPTRGSPTSETRYVEYVPIAVWSKSDINRSESPASSGGTSSDRTSVVMPQPVRPVGSCVVVGCVTELYTDEETELGLGLGSTDEEKRMSLEKDTCPGLISDGLNRVRWTNEAYRRLVNQDGWSVGEEARAPEMVWLVVMNNNNNKEACPQDGRVGGLPVGYPGFTCRVRLQYTCRKERNSLIVPCDVWRMDGGGFAWRLDVKAALSLGR